MLGILEAASKECRLTQAGRYVGLKGAGEGRRFVFLLLRPPTTQLVLMVLRGRDDGRRAGNGRFRETYGDEIVLVEDERELAIQPEHLLQLLVLSGEGHGMDSIWILSGQALQHRIVHSNPHFDCPIAPLIAIEF